MRENLWEAKDNHTLNANITYHPKTANAFVTDKGGIFQSSPDKQLGITEKEVQA